VTYVRATSAGCCLVSSVLVDVVRTWATSVEGHQFGRAGLTSGPPPSLWQWAIPYIVLGYVDCIDLRSFGVPAVETG
jgi:hypothetical protein